jgi:ABC-type Mn2+/Zn2+ transport system ATPase subunit
VRDVVRMGRLAHFGTWRWPRPADEQAVVDALVRVGIGDRADRSVGALSGGEQRRVMLAQALCASERLLVLDEPTIGLDLPAEQAFYALLRELQRELGLAVIAVSHDLLALAAAADELVCINRTMHVHGNPDEVVHSHALREAYSCEFNFIAGEIAHHEKLGRHD